MRFKAQKALQGYTPEILSLTCSRAAIEHERAELCNDERADLLFDRQHVVIQVWAPSGSALRLLWPFLWNPAVLAPNSLDPVLAELR